MKAKIENIKEVLRNNPNVDFAYLFGSRAKGTAGDRSDWDIAVHFKKEPAKLPQWSIFYLEAEISNVLKEDVQIITLNNLDSPVLLFEVISNGLQLIDNDPEKRILFETDVLKHYHDWQYYLNRHMKKNASVI